MKKIENSFYGLLCILAVLFAIIKWFFDLIIEHWIVSLIIFVPLIIVLLFSSNYRQKKKQAKLAAIDQSQIDNMDGLEFEHYVCQLLKYNGFSARVTPGSNDYGVDIVASKNGDKYAIQVKRQVSNVSRRAVSDSVAGKNYYSCNRSMVITNSYFSNAAIELAEVNACELIDRDTLIEWIMLLNKSL